MDLAPITLEGRYVRLEPLAMDHHDQLIEAAADGQLWDLRVTCVPSPEMMAAYIEATRQAREQGRELPFAIIQKPSRRVVGSIRFHSIEPAHRRVEIGGLWIAASWQRTPIHTEAEFLLLCHAFEVWECLRVQYFTDVLNERSRAALKRIGAKEEGILRYHMVMRGRHRDSVSLSIIQPEWPAVKANLKAKLAKPYVEPIPVG